MGKKKYTLLPMLMICCLTAGGCGLAGNTAEDTGIHESVPTVQGETQTKETGELTEKPTGETSAEEIRDTDTYSAELIVLPGAGHGLHGQDAETATEYILEYLEAHCR